MQLAAIFLVIEDFMLPCMSKQLFGMDCPGCGLQRSVVFLLKGEFVEAFKMYPAIYPMLLLFGFLTVDFFIKLKYANKISIFLMISTVVLILGNFILKLI